jgi:hypothetical protein
MPATTRSLRATLRHPLRLLLLLGLTTSGTAWGQPPVPVTSIVVGSDPAPSVGQSPAQPSATLYEQVSAGSFAIASQNFEPNLDSLDSAAADDFSVPEGVVWVISSVEVRGKYEGGAQHTVDSVNIAFYGDSGGFPGTPFGSTTAVPVGDVSGGNLVVNLSTSLRGGETYWISAQVNKNFTTTGQWLWFENTAQHLNPSVWRNPGGGANPNCPNWARRVATCGVGSDPDLVFRLFGSVLVTDFELFLPLAVR